MGTSKAKPQPSGSHQAVVAGASFAFQRFAKAMRALVAVPKSEMEEKLAEQKTEREKLNKSIP
jgi:hypothetical protein